MVPVTRSGGGSKPKPKDSSAEAVAAGSRRWVMVGTVLVGAVVVWATLGRIRRGPVGASGGPGQGSAASEYREGRSDGGASDRTAQAAAFRRARPGSGREVSPTAVEEGGLPRGGVGRVDPVSPDRLGPATAESLGLVKALTEVSLAAGKLTPEQAVQWKKSLENLVAQGASAVPAIRDFLRAGGGVEFGAAGFRSVGYGSAREAMADVLARIGGPEALGVTLEAIQGNRNPREVALLAQALEAQAPEQQREAALAAARGVLASARQGEMQGKDVGPVFEVLERYGGASVVADLEQSAGEWKYYSTIALAQLPDGAGVPSLVRMLTESKGTDVPSLEALASISTRNAEARDALLTNAREGNIHPNVWPYVAQALAGDELQVADSVFDRVLSRSDGKELKSTHINAGNQTFYRSPTIDTLTLDQVQAQAALVEEFLGLAGSNPAATKALLQTKGILERRLAKFAPVLAPSPGP